VRGSAAQAVKAPSVLLNCATHLIPTTFRYQTTIRPGDIVSADDDGVVVVPKETIAEVCSASAAREDKEAQVMKALEAGGDILELSGIGKVLESKNCTYA
jgi:regulator of RNase E activity RraA